MLRITLHINEEQIADYQVLNVEDLGAGTFRYEVSPIVDGTTVTSPVLDLEHNRMLGAEFLAAMALFRLSMLRDEQPDEGRRS